MNEKKIKQFTLFTSIYMRYLIVLFRANQIETARFL